MANNHEENPNLRLVIKALVPLSLLVGGIALLFSKIAGWGIIMGLPMTVIGVVFLIYTYDEVSHFKDNEY